MDCDALRDDMLDVLYGEATSEVRRRVEQHQSACAACRDELAGFAGVRRDLAVWKLPVLSLPRRAPSLWLGAAAALLVGLAGGFFAHSSWQPVASTTVAMEDVKRLLDEQEARHHQEIQSLRTAIVPAGPDRQAVLARVEELIRASEARQGRAISVNLSEISRRQAAQRRHDLAQLSASFAYLEGKSGLEAARTTELMGRILQASERR